MTTVPLAFFWGDDELSASRAVDRFEATLAAEGGAPLERWTLRGNRNAAATLLADLNERVATPVMFGGGTLAIVLNPGALVVRNEDRDAFLATLTLVAPGNALVVLDSSQSGAKAPAPKRVADAIAAAGGVVRPFMSPKGGGLAGWIEAEARERGLTLAPGAAKVLAERVGGFVQEGDVERRHQTRVASMELDKLALYRGTAPISARRRRGAGRRGRAGFGLGVHRCGRRTAGRSRPSSCSNGCSRPRPSRCSSRSSTGGSASSSRSAIGSPPASGCRRSARRWGSPASSGCGRSAARRRTWTTAELTAALDGLVELDAMVKGAPGSEIGDAQRRLAFDLWVVDHVGRAGADA